MNNFHLSFLKYKLQNYSESFSSKIKKFHHNKGNKIPCFHPVSSFLGEEMLRFSRAEGGGAEVLLTPL